MNKDTFEKFGANFQTLLLSALLNDKGFFEQIYEIMQPQYFSSQPHQYLTEKILNYFNEYNCVPSMENVDIIVNQIGEPTLKTECYETLIRVRQSQVTDLEYVKDNTVEFCKQQSMKTAILESVELLEQNKYTDIQALIEKALNSGEKHDLGHEFFDDFEKRTAITNRDPVTTGWAKMDDLMDGGHGNGELGVVIAPTGGGKSFVLVNLGYGALKAGKNVLHYTLELSEEAVGLRYDSRITDVPIRDIKNYPDIVQKKLSTFKSGRLIIKEYPIKSASVNTIKFHLNRLAATGFHPDLIIVDYADIMKSRRHYEVKRYELESIYEDLRALAQEVNVPVWTASQTNRSAIDEEIITLSSIAEAYAKAQVSDFIVSLSRKMVDKLNNTGRFYVAKNRNGMDGVIVPLVVNTTNGKIGMQDSQEDISQAKPHEIQEVQTQSDSSTQQNIKKRLAEIKEM